MAALNETFEYMEIALDSYDASNPTVNSWINSASPVNQLASSFPKFEFTSRQPILGGIKILSAEIPFTWDVINAGNNTFVITTSGVPATITVPVGTYTGTSLAPVLQAAIGGGITVLYIASSLRFSFTQTAAVTWSISFPTKNSLWSELGFLALSTTSASGAGSVITSPTVAMVNGPTYLYINSPTFGPLTNFNTADNAANKGIGPEMCRVPVNASYGQTVIYEDPCKKFLI